MWLSCAVLSAILLAVFAASTDEQTQKNEAADWNSAVVDNPYLRALRSSGKPSFIRFGKRAQPSFIRFGRAQPSFIRFGRSSYLDYENESQLQ